MSTEKGEHTVKRLPEVITFTGADDNIDVKDVKDMQRLSDVYPIEWAVLFSPSGQGARARYPSSSSIQYLVDSGLRMAIHLCGKPSRDIMDGMMPFVPVDLKAFQRIQVNSRNPSAHRISDFQRHVGVSCIAQARGDIFPDGREIGWLFDVSGGRGESPGHWPKHPGYFVGYAGGISCDNVVSVLEEINASGRYWIDMESGVRTENRFDLELCRKVCELVYG